mmetsp:Transcript_98547/g.120673  ORF Transcript_98547/g.120673 Transcript_98547/m.120673 type:complete len:349 (-) Transcript_98547:147-1193(-)
MSETEFNENKVSNVTNNLSNENDGKIKKFSRYLFPSNLFGVNKQKEETLQFMDKDGNIIENESDIDGKLSDNKKKKKSKLGIFSKIFRKKTTNKNEIDSSNDNRVMVSKQNICPIKIVNDVDLSDDMNLVCTPKFTFSDDDDISVNNIDSDLDVYSETVNNICTDTVNDNNNSVKHISINNENKNNDRDRDRVHRKRVTDRDRINTDRVMDRESNRERVTDRMIDRDRMNADRVRDRDRNRERDRMNNNNDSDDDIFKDDGHKTLKSLKFEIGDFLDVSYKIQKPIKKQYYNNSNNNYNRYNKYNDNNFYRGRGHRGRYKNRNYYGNNSNNFNRDYKPNNNRGWNSRY